MIGLLFLDTTKRGREVLAPILHIRVVQLVAQSLMWHSYQIGLLTELTYGEMFVVFDWAQVEDRQDLGTQTFYQ